MALKYKDVDKEVKDNQAIYKLAKDKGINIAQAREQYYGTPLEQAAEKVTSKNVNKQNYSQYTQPVYNPYYNYNGHDPKTNPTYNQKVWLYADSIGDEALKEAAHQAEEANKSAQGFSGGLDGNQRIPLTDKYGDFSFRSSPVFYDRYGDQVTAQRDKILNREDFSYNPEEDALYQQLRAQYTREGNRAMKDTIGEVSARTGGLASSYAGTAATQANQYYAQQLADRIPELQQLAYSMYMDDLNNDRADLDVLENERNNDIALFEDAYNKWLGERNFANNQYWENYKAEKEAEQELKQEQIYEEERAYEIAKGEETDAYKRVSELLSMGIMPKDELLAKANYNKDDASQVVQAVKASQTRSTGGGGSKDSGEFFSESQAWKAFQNPEGALLSDKAIASYVEVLGISPSLAAEMTKQLDAGLHYYDPDWKGGSASTQNGNAQQKTASDLFLRPWTFIWGDK